MSTRPRQPSGRPTIVVQGLSPSVTVVELRGEHDLNTTDELRSALGRAANQAFLIIDLSECTFIDSSALNTLLSTHRRQTKRGGRFEFVIPTKADAVDRTMRLAKVDAIVTTHETRSAALAGIQSDP